MYSKLNLFYTKKKLPFPVFSSYSHRNWSHLWHPSLHDSPHPFHLIPDPEALHPKCCSNPPTSLHLHCHPPGPSYPRLSPRLLTSPSALPPLTPQNPIKKCIGQLVRFFCLKLSNGFILHLDHSKIFNMANKPLHYLSPFYLSNFISHHVIPCSLHSDHTLPWAHQVLSQLLDFAHNVSLPEMYFPTLHLTAIHPSGFGLNTISSDMPSLNPLPHHPHLPLSHVRSRAWNSIQQILYEWS